MIHGFSSRKRLALLLATTLLSIGVTAGTASAATSTFTNSSLIAIPDNTQAVPYPSTINVSGFAGNVQKVTATLHGFHHTCPDDLAVLLVGPSGVNSTLMGNVGGCPGGSSFSPIDLTFDQASGNALNDTDVASSGTYRPSESGPTALSSPAPSGPYPVN